VKEGLDELGEPDIVLQPDNKKEEVSSPVKTHEEILSMIKELKELEERYSAFEIIEIVEEGEELIEVDYGELTEPAIPVTPEEIKKPGFGNKFKKIKIFRIKVSSKSERLAKKAEKSATFKIRFDETGNLVNLDFRKPVPKEPSKLKSKIVGKIPKLKKRGSKKGDKSGDREKGKKDRKKKSKGSKVKGGFGKIGKLKKVIPGKKPKKNKSKKKK